MDDDTDPTKLRLRAIFEIDKPKIFVGELISQQVEFEYLENGNVMKVDCKNCLWKASKNYDKTFEPRSIGPLARDMTYLPIITITTNLNLIKDDATNAESGLTKTSCRGKPFSTTFWFCIGNKQQIPSSQVCDGKPDCVDESDEDPLRCKGSLDHFWILAVLSYFALGFFIFPGTLLFYLHTTIAYL